MRRRFELEPGEEILDEWVAGVPSKSGRTASIGGTLVLTNRRLIWEALRLPRGIDWMAFGTLLDRMTGGVPLSEINGARADEERKMTLHVETADDGLRLLVSATRWSPIWSKKNQAARDDAVARINSMIG